MGLDYGEKTIGVAISDPRGKIAFGVETVRREDPAALKASVRRLGEIIKEYGVEEIVLGYPKNMNGTVSQRCISTEAFKAKLERNFKRMPVALWDERLSTMAVTRVFEGKSSRYDRFVDEMAAVYILQGYLDFKNKKTEASMEEELSNIVMCDEQGNEVEYMVLSAKEKDGSTYMLVEEIQPDLEDMSLDDEIESQVLFFKCVGTEGEEMVFELVDDEHEDFAEMMALFKEDFTELDIEIDDVDIEEIGE